ncbi:predicted protein [Uncinocarpus reesii 1704]|uniref:GAT domain-containing protein n=1 Tax=Uncinocarpus reesii (strain UAMH 1704) TaxID=336963 RepID=C4JXZ5_UNCRE|nr:uncharacterized protein UREG_07046 [Uncinocarpus reesii 1704]EEP82181.1 predicted protein [Uncinocarpus reesii 1704]
MKRLVGTLKRTKGIGAQLHRSNGASYPQESLENSVVTEIGDEFLHLPAIVEAAESTPAAARAAAHQIYKYLSKPNGYPEHQQYNAIMLIRILSDNPGPTFTRHIDARFVSSLKILLRDGQEVSVQQILRETLEFLATTKARDTNLSEVNNMWQKEKDKFVKMFGVHPLQGPAHAMYPGYRQDFFSRNQRSKGLPSQEELAGRISEAATSAKLLLQMVASTSSSEFFENDMLKEFASRCQRASRSLQNYMEATDPAPDEETMMTLIETNDKISVALSRYQRAHLNARKTVKASESQTQLPQTPQGQSQDDRPVSPLEEPTPVRRSRPHVPILSIPRKALKKFQHQPFTQEPAQPPPTTTTVHTATTTTTTTTAHDLSPIDPAPPSVPGPRSQHGDASSSQGFQYRPGEFQVENPFADKFSTTHDRPQDAYSTNRSSSDDARREREDRDVSPTQAIGVATSGGAAPGMSSTYYPGGHDALFDSDFSLPPLHRNDGAGNTKV